ISAGKPAMLYFSSQPVVLDTVDTDQWEQLKAFKESCQKRSLYETYDSHGDFKDKFYRQLQLKINEHELFQSSETNPRLGEIVESRTPLPTVSVEARILLKEASQDPEGSILRLRHLGGTVIQTNGKN